MFKRLLGPPSPALLRVTGLKVIVNQIYGDGLDVPGDSIGMLDRELKQRTAIVGTKLYIRLLHKVVNHLLWGWAPLPRSANN
jgi:hypothetical protein